MFSNVTLATRGWLQSDHCQSYGLWAEHGPHGIKQKNRRAHTKAPVPSYAYQEICWDRGVIETIVRCRLSCITFMLRMPFCLCMLSLLCILGPLSVYWFARVEPEELASKAHGFKHQLLHSLLHQRIRLRLQPGQAALKSSDVILHDIAWHGIMEAARW